jgi:8-oxo-dGTP diphosphatase
MKYTKIGCEAWIEREGKVLLYKRGAGKSIGTWSLPGGHLEFLERVDDGIIRELEEELGLNISVQDIWPIAITDDLRPELDEHYLHITFNVDIGNQQPLSQEPEKCAELQWFPIDDLPNDLFPFQAKVFDTLASKKLYNKQV